jgi:hypothetical protein
MFLAGAQLRFTWSNAKANFLEMQNLFVIERSKTHRKENAQFRDCQRHNLPLVKITPGGRLASVEIDMFPTDRNFDEATENQMVAVCAEHTAPENIRACAIQCIADRVPRAAAESLAKKLFESAVSAMSQLPPVIPRA